MPDLMIEYVRVCSSLFHWKKTVQGSNGNQYVVEWHLHNGGWYCSCPAFQFNRRKECKHIKAVKEEKCDWNHEAFAGSWEEANRDGTCPKCGEETEVVKIGV